MAEVFDDGFEGLWRDGEVGELCNAMVTGNGVELFLEINKIFFFVVAAGDIVDVSE